MQRRLLLIAMVSVLAGLVVAYTLTAKGPKDDGAAWELYTNDQYHFSLRYPGEASLSELQASAGVARRTGTLLLLGLEFPEYSKADNQAYVTVAVYKVGALPSYWPDHSDGCDIWRQSVRVVEDERLEMVEHKNCPVFDPGRQGLHEDRHLLKGLVRLSQDYDLLYEANMGNRYIRESGVGNAILDTLTWTEEPGGE